MGHGLLLALSNRLTVQCVGSTVNIYQVFWMRPSRQWALLCQSWTPLSGQLVETELREGSKQTVTQTQEWETCNFSQTVLTELFWTLSLWNPRGFFGVGKRKSVNITHKLQHCVWRGFRGYVHWKQAERCRCTRFLGWGRKHKHVQIQRCPLWEIHPPDWSEQRAAKKNKKKKTGRFTLYLTKT